MSEDAKIVFGLVGFFCMMVALFFYGLVQSRRKWNAMLESFSASVETTGWRKVDELPAGMRFQVVDKALQSSFHGLERHPGLVTKACQGGRSVFAMFPTDCGIVRSVYAEHIVAFFAVPQTDCNVNATRRGAHYLPAKVKGWRDVEKSPVASSDWQLRFAPPESESTRIVLRYLHSALSAKSMAIEVGVAEGWVIIIGQGHLVGFFKELWPETGTESIEFAARLAATWPETQTRSPKPSP